MKKIKILVIRLSSLGDIVLTEPIIKGLKTHYQGCEIYYLVKPHFAGIVEAFPEEVKIIHWNNNLNSLLKLKKYKFDLVIDLHNKPNTALIRFFCGHSRKVVYNKQHKLRKQIVKKTTDKSISSTLELYNSVLTKLQILNQKDYPVLKGNISGIDILDKYNLIKEKFIMIFPGATSFTKRWLPEYFVELIEKIDNYEVIIAGSNSDMAIAKHISESSSKKVINLAGNTSLKELITLIFFSRAVIANDSGPAHIAAALKKPQITIFGATSPKLGFAPLNKNGIILSRNLSCSPCSLHGSESCPLGHFNCMKDIKAEEVFEELRKIDIDE